MRKLLSAMALAVALGGSDVAAEQFISDGWSWTILVPSVAQTDILGSHLRELRNEDARRKMPPLDVSRLGYTPSKARRSANLAAFVERTRAVDPNGAADLQRLFAEGDVIERIRALIAPVGLRIDNLADAYALWWITAWQATRGENDTLGRDMYAAVRAQAARALNGAGSPTRASDAEKQELAEALLVQTALIDGAVEQAKRNPARMRQVRAAVAKGAQRMGLDMAKMEITGGGFVLNGKR
ncbi:hypothetical protein J2848_000402 [Azospirillum lipoferum]|uniref:Uncharacterized protein n=1 Tax=Azospirillum lipoferum TaxID=193 RepID=A0A5A9GRZ6_AZOLI|nr:MULTISPECIES: DUF6683 family protein [Azospirillum]KAA0597251.1 hypothetical protein FZ942_09185 [Azospirillum lipoferum]MCP1608766.1 hypothetical protein [Azospirillum lipoferum]MDW5535918.1 DUF6683 family protein [Azospirillum sp. NL1]